jgi:hypothetical protein
VAVVSVPSGAPQYDIDWCVEVGAEVSQGQPLAWLCAPGRCALEPLAAPVSGRLVARWTGLLRTVLAGEGVALVGDGDAAAVRALEAQRLAQLVETTREELRALEAKRAKRTGAGAALLDADVARVTKWLEDAQRALGEAGVRVA